MAAYLAYHKDPHSFIPVVGIKGKERSLRTCLKSLIRFIKVLET